MNEMTAINEITAKSYHVLLTCIVLRGLQKRVRASSCRKTDSKIVLQLYLSHVSVHTSVWVFSCKFAIYFQNIFS